MTDQAQKQQLGKTLWNIADQLRGTMNADDFRDYMLSLLFLSNLSDTYQNRPKLVERYARHVDMKEIAANDFNLNISRYISTAEAETEIDLAATHAELVRLEGVIQEATAKHNQFLKELGLSPLPPANSE